MIMGLLPAAFKIMLNIFFYCVYVIITVFLTGLILGEFFDMRLDQNDSNATKITLVMMVLILIITFLYRKFFYIELKSK